MHKFLVKIRDRKLLATDLSKQDFLERLLDSYADRNIVVSITFEVPEKDINEGQVKLYRAFILKAAEHFGTDFREMQQILKNLEPTDASGNRLPLKKWSTNNLNTFIDRSSSYLSEYGFNF
jgi:hypothetical protein